MRPGTAEKVWLALVGLTLAGAWLAERGEAGTPLTLVVAALIAVKGRAVIDCYMELRDANRTIRRILYAFNAAVATLVVVTHWCGDAIARFTTIG
jgi:ABC-type nickel/cobalt efflux system permease component RcnA